MKRILSAIAMITVFFMLFSALPVLAQTIPSYKEEVVYGILNPDGSVSSLYVVNIFQGGAVADYGDYTEIKNLTNSDKISKDGDFITADTEAEKFYYQGTLGSKKLPWDISIKYLLNGKEISADKLAGKSGALEIKLSIKQNPDINSVFYDDYALQITLQLDTRLCANITAQNATIADAGKNKQLSYIALPGRGADISVFADVLDFEMEPVTINGIRLSLDIPIEKEAFSGLISQLKGAAGELDGGAEGLLYGASRLSEGFERYISGLQAFGEGSALLGGGLKTLGDGAASLKDGLGALTAQNEALVNGALAIRQSVFDSANMKLSEMNLGLPVLTPQNYAFVLEGISGLAALKAQLDGAVGFADGLISYTGGVLKLSEGASELADGAYALKNSAADINHAAQELYNAGVELGKAVSELKGALAEYKNGTAEFKNGVLGMDEKIETLIEEIALGITGGEEEAMSFVSEKNTAVSSVQFVLKTGAIEKGAEPAETENPVELSFWQRLLRLFGL